MKLRDDLLIYSYEDFDKALKEGRPLEGIVKIDRIDKFSIAFVTELNGLQFKHITFSDEECLNIVDESNVLFSPKKFIEKEESKTGLIEPQNANESHFYKTFTNEIKSRVLNNEDEEHLLQKIEKLENQNEQQLFTIKMQAKSILNLSEKI